MTGFILRGLAWAAACMAALPLQAHDRGVPSDEDVPVQVHPQASEFHSAYDPQRKQITTAMATTDGKRMAIVVDKVTDTVRMRSPGPRHQERS